MQTSERVVLTLNLNPEERRKVEEVAASHGCTFEEALSGMFSNLLSEVVNHPEVGDN